MQRSLKSVRMMMAHVNSHCYLALIVIEDTTCWRRSFGREAQGLPLDPVGREAQEHLLIVGWQAQKLSLRIVIRETHGLHIDTAGWDRLLIQRHSDRLLIPSIGKYDDSLRYCWSGSTRTSRDTVGREVQEICLDIVGWALEGPLLDAFGRTVKGSWLNAVGQAVQRFHKDNVRIYRLPGGRGNPFLNVKPFLVLNFNEHGSELKSSK
ncbi:hypothetical protein PoB_004873400 [Plakobranchus ocellatus]|uniref:Uncharacterized protein n=1 Tax=Plakobranchus ocellatus TaxID=259542 RepID=A0AAV4BV00_9GAST|nr:hypothetical protein PoB_004873400 [Plakobranchus ocellatus]